MLDSLAAHPQFVFLLIQGLIIVGLPVLAILSISGISTWRKLRTARFACELKSNMIAAGMSADDIERVLAAKVSER